MTDTAAFDPEVVVEALQRDGVVKLDGFLPPPVLAAVHRELEAARDARGDTSDPPLQRGPTIYPTSLFAHRKLGEISAIASVMDSPVIDAVRRRLIGRSAYVTDIVGIESLPEHRIVTQWHVDGTKSCIAHPGDARIKFFFYLNDVTSRNGAFSYVPGTHKILDTVHRAMHEGEIPPESLRDLSDIRAYFARMAPALPPAQQTLADEMFAAIETDTSPCGPYSLEGPPGTLVIFDERGMHRGGDIDEGRRSILRISLKRETVDGIPALARTAARKIGRVVLPSHYARLM